MARHLTWCLKRTFVLTTHFHTHLQARLVAKMSNSVVQKAHLAASGVNKLGFNVEEEQDHRDLEMFVEDAKKGKGHAISALMMLLYISKAAATKAVDAYPAFRSLQKKTIYENFQILRESGMFKSTIKDNEYVLIGTPEEVKLKINLVKSFGVEINEAVALFHLSIMRLKMSSYYTKIDNSYLPTRNKLYYLAEKFNIDIVKICHAVSYNPFILTMPPPKLMTITEYVIAAGMAPEHILSDMSLFKFPLSTIKAKIEKAKALDIHPLRPWLLRCGERSWETARERFARRGVLFEHGISREQLICEIFECDADIAQCIIKRSHKISIMGFEKLHNNLKLFKAQGYTAEDVMVATLIVQRRTSTLETLFKMWNEAGLPKGRLCLFCKNPEQLQEIINERCAELQNGHQS